jgi:hypothetical protein
MGTPMKRLVRESTDLVVAKTLRDALENYGRGPWQSVEEIVAALIADSRIDRITADYVLANIRRFALCPEPTWVDAKWHAGASA